MARYLRLPFIPAIDPARSPTCRAWKPVATPEPGQDQPSPPGAHVAGVPEARRLADLKAALLAMPLLGQDLAIAIPSWAPRAVSRSGATRRVRETINGLFERFLSSRPAWYSQAPRFSAGLGLAALPTALIATPIGTLLFLHIVLLIYFAFAAVNRQQFAGPCLLRRVVRSLTDRAHADQPLPRNPATDCRNYDHERASRPIY
jgi:glycosyltransferase XagB